MNRKFVTISNSAAEGSSGPPLTGKSLYTACDLVTVINNPLGGTTHWSLWGAGNTIYQDEAGTTPATNLNGISVVDDSSNTYGINGSSEIAETSVCGGSSIAYWENCTDWDNAAAQSLIWVLNDLHYTERYCLPSTIIDGEFIRAPMAYQYTNGSPGSTSRYCPYKEGYYGNCDDSITAQNLIGYVYSNTAPESWEVGTMFYSDLGLGTPLGPVTVYVNGYSYATDGTGAVTTKTICSEAHSTWYDAQNYRAGFDADTTLYTATGLFNGAEVFTDSDLSLPVSNEEYYSEDTWFVITSGVITAIGVVPFIKNFYESCTANPLTLYSIPDAMIEDTTYMYSSLVGEHAAWTLYSSSGFSMGNGGLLQQYTDSFGLFFSEDVCPT